jgi:hypothetical protein
MDDNQPFLEENGKKYLLDFNSGKYLPINDVREEIAVISAKAHQDKVFEEAFIAHRLQSANIAGKKSSGGQDNENETPPVPGGVGYGVFYQDNFKNIFKTGTVLAVDIICPSKPGGNVSNWLYLTAMNRAAKGIEAFILYYGQNFLSFRVFDWARSDHWQVNLPYENVRKYLCNKSFHGANYQVMGIQNQTYCVSGNRWRNDAWALVLNVGYDLIYSYEYTASEADQKDAYYGSWGPIVETFQDSYSGISPLGFYNTYLQARDSANQWTNFALLTDSQSYIRNDRQGFKCKFLDPNYTFGVE